MPIVYLQDSRSVLAVVVERDAVSDPPFVTDPSEPVQVGTFAWKEGHIVSPHRHPSRVRVVTETQEALFVRRGKILVTVYDDAGRHVSSRIMGEGDVVVFLRGGHAVRALTDSDVVEIKQGPYDPDRDKVRFQPEER